MFIRVKKIGPYEYLYLVGNAREDGRHVQRVIKALGRRDAIENSDLLDGLIASAARPSRRSIVLSSFCRGELPVSLLPGSGGFANEPDHPRRTAWQRGEPDAGSRRSSRRRRSSGCWRAASRSRKWRPSWA